MDTGTVVTPVNIELFSVELEAFAREVGASPTKQIVLVLDGAGWHDSPRVRVPEHVHLLFLPPHCPELQPAEHLWPLTNTVLVNRHFTSIEALEDAQAERCVALQACPELIRSTTRFSWWPQRIHRRHGPHVRLACSSDVSPHGCRLLERGAAQHSRRMPCDTPMFWCSKPV